MKNKHLLFILLLFLSSFNIFCNNQKIGITRLYSPYKKIDLNFHLNLEDKLMDAISDIPSKEFYALNLQNKFTDIKQSLKLWRENTNDITSPKIDKKYSNIINEIKNLDYCIAYEIVFYQIKKERDFYDIDKFWLVFKLDLRVLIIDCMNKTFIEEYDILVEFKSEKEKSEVIKDGLKKVLKKFRLYLEDSSSFKLKIHLTKIKPVFVWIDAGKKDGIKPQNILISYEEDKYKTQEHTVLRIIKADKDKSLANILYTKGNLNKKQFFTKASKINLEIQLGGGFSISNKDNPVRLTTQGVSILSFASIRGLIPVGIPFFRPGFQVEFNFFYLDNKLLLPFTFETGCQGELYIHRFEADIGLMIGALFSPDLNNNYQLDSVVIRPYLHLSGMLVTQVKIFGEFGYKFFMEGNLYKNWKIDLKGIYFSFGIGVNL